MIMIIYNIYNHDQFYSQRCLYEYICAAYMDCIYIYIYIVYMHVCVCVCVWCVCV